MTARKAIFKIALAAVVLTLASGWAYRSLKKHWSHQPYPKLKIGMSSTEVAALFGGPPGEEFRVQGHRVWYLAEPSRNPPPALFPWLKPQPYRGQQREFESLDQLPDLYAWVQVLFDAEDRTWAFCYIGECYVVQCDGGQAEGSHLKHVGGPFEMMLRAQPDKK
jgi:hypothetical protein